MKKIIGGIVGLFAVVVMVAGVGYAVYVDTVSMTGMVLGTATPGLELSLDNGANWLTSIDVPDNAFAPLMPGEMDWGEFWLRNNSDGTTDLLNMALTARLATADGDWNDLKNAVQMRVCKYDSTSVAYHCDEANATPWYYLSTWNTADVTLPLSPLNQGVTEHYAIVFRIPSSFGNEVSGKQLTNVSFVVSGTQTP